MGGTDVTITIDAHMADRLKSPWGRTPEISGITGV